MVGNPTLDIFVVAGIVAAGLGLVTVLARGSRWLWKLFQSLDDFLDDLRGAPARPGVPERPGVMERLARLETGLTTITHEVTTNDGSSLKDAVRRVEQKLDTHMDGLED
ncbi:hypothetical protein [Nonomuraea fuscirosea]|uniref:hypothetical protein n=1 Tax=Nonomuraea fuscirosea TaxID=1291556 RepID=UPI003410AE26